MTVASLIERLQTKPVTPVTPKKTTVLPEKIFYLIDSIEENHTVTPVTPVTPPKEQCQAKKSEFSEFAHLWVSPPQAQAATHADLAVAGCSNCEAATTKRWHGGYTMQCVGCMARLVLSARPLRHAQEAMLACNNGRPDLTSRQSVLDWLKAKATRP
jgi:hypothetical protein